MAAYPAWQATIVTEASDLCGQFKKQIIKG